MFNKYIERERIVANTDSNIYGINKYFDLFFKREVSSYKNRVDINVVIHDIKPKKLFFKIKNTITKL